MLYAIYTHKGGTLLSFTSDMAEAEALSHMGYHVEPI